MGAWSFIKALIVGLLLGSLIVGCADEVGVQASSAPSDSSVIEEPAVVLEAPDALEDVVVPEHMDPRLSLPPYDPQSDEVSFRFRTYLGDQASEPDLVGDFNVTLLASGQVVLVEGTSIYDGAESYFTWQLSESGYRQLVEYLLGHQLYQQQLGSNDRAYSISLGALIALDAHPNEGPIDEQTEVALHELTDRLRNHSWLGAEVTSDPAPWIPPEVEFSARPGLPETHEGAPKDLGEPVTWPLDRTIGEIGVPTVDSRGREVFALCLSGDEAAAAWSLVREGVNHAWMPVSDGEDWTLTHQIRYPGYNPSSLC